MAQSALNFLRPAGALYGALMSTRSALYRTGLLRARRLGVPVICIGNLTTGGTGKSPFVEYVVRILADSGHKPGIASRGYRRRTPASQIVTVSDGAGQIASPDEGGDEPVMLARALGRVPVVVCADRHTAGERLVSQFACDIVVLDDGFQHLPLHRDLDIVLIDATVDLAAEPLLPAGHRREPLSALGRAGAIVHTRADGPCLEANRIVARRHAPEAREFAARFTPDHLMAPGGHPMTMDSLAGKRVFALCGLARPEPFLHSLHEAGCEVVAHPCPDHEPYPPDLLQRLAAKAREAKCAFVVTTAKDAVKLPPDGSPFTMPVLVLRQRVVLDDDEAFRRMVLGTVRHA